MSDNNRREFLKKSGLLALPLFLPTNQLEAASRLSQHNLGESDLFPVSFLYDGLDLSPSYYIAKLNEINESNPIEEGFYLNGGITNQLEKEFAKITGKEKAIFVPTGTLANQLAIKILSGENSKVIVPENSHIFRDEADAAQSVNDKRLIPVGRGKDYYDLNDLKAEINYLDKNEAFKSGLYTVAVENPVRRADERAIPIETIKSISEYCRHNGYRLHLDGAHIHIASAFTGVSVAEYASYFDTVYISLYKYLNGCFGAMLCGEGKVIDKVPHLIKIYGGTILQAWPSTAVAYHYLNGIEERLQQTIQTSKKLIAELNKIEGVNISSINGGTNIFYLKLDEKLDYDAFRNFLREEYSILLRPISEDKIVKFVINESVLTRNSQEIVNAWKIGVKKFKF